MLGLARFVIIGFVALTVIYISVSLYSRSVRRAKLELEWDDEGMEGDKQAWVREGLEDYDHSLRRKLILLVYVIPVVIVGTIIYVVNHG